MKLNVYFNNKLYKTVDFGNVESYDPKEITDIILADKAANAIPPSFKLSEGMAVRIEKV